MRRRRGLKGTGDQHRSRVGRETARALEKIGEVEFALKQDGRARCALIEGDLLQVAKFMGRAEVHSEEAIATQEELFDKGVPLKEVKARMKEVLPKYARRCLR